MGAINLASWGFFFGAVGQGIVFASLFQPRSPWAIQTLVTVPWVMVFVVSFCGQPPFGPRPFRYTLEIAMAWYAAASFIGEGFCYWHQAPHSLEVTLARASVLLASPSYVFLVRVCAALRRLEAEEQDSRSV